MRAALRAGAALFAAGHHRAAHEPWEDAWREADDDRDERLLQGLVQYAAAVHHARERNWEGCLGLAESGHGYLDGLPDGYRDVNVDTVRGALADLAADPERVERGPRPSVAIGGEVPTLGDLDLDATLLVAPPLAESLGYDREAVERGVEYARADAADGEEGSEFVRFVFDFVRDADHRGIVVRRLDQHGSRRERREEDVAGLFD